MAAEMHAWACCTAMTLLASLYLKLCRSDSWQPDDAKLWLLGGLDAECWMAWWGSAAIHGVFAAKPAAVKVFCPTKLTG